MIAGETVAHRFVLKNITDQVLRIADGADVKKNCGCADLEPEAKTLSPGDETRVRVALHTAGRHGAFRYGGEMIWRGADGSKWPVSLNISGTILQPLVCEPGELSFDSATGNLGNEKMLSVRAQIAIRPGTLQVLAHSQHVQFFDVNVSDGTLTCRVRYDIPSGVEFVQDIVTLHAEVDEKLNERLGETVSVQIPIVARQSVSLVAIPPMLHLTPDSDTRRLVGRVMLRGADVVGPTFLRGVHSDFGHVEWSVTTPTSSSTAILTLNLTPRESGDRSRTCNIRLETERGSVMTLPCIWDIPAEAGSD